MNYTIGFPNLGLWLSHVGKSISVFGLEIAFYGITIACAMVSGLYLAMYVAKKTGQDPDEYFNFALIAMIVSVIGARLYYVAFSWDYYSAHPGEILNLRGGGLAIYGGVIAGALTAVVWSRVRHMKLRTMLDTACIGLVLGQAIGRWGNFFNREAFGSYSDGLLAMALPVDAVRASEITERMRDAVLVRDGVSFIQVHPTFLYESMWNLGVIAVLMIVTFKKKKRFPGEVVLLYFGLYGLGRLWIEGLRTDQLLLWGTQIPVSQALAAVMFAAASVCLCIGSRKNASKGKHR